MYYLLLETLKSELVFIRELITIYTLLHTFKNNTLLEIANAIAELTTQIIQISTAKISEIILVKVNINKPFKVFIYFNYKI